MKRFSVVWIALILAACGGASQTTSTTTSAGTSGTADVVTTTVGVPTASDPESPRSVRDIGIDKVTLHATDEGRPHPTLSWDPVSGAVTYWLTLRDGSGAIYWAWSGEETNVRVGGGDTPDLNQTAALHEPMTWSVIAVDEAGTLIGLSDFGSVAP